MTVKTVNAAKTETATVKQELTHDQRVKMNETIREYNSKGQPELAEPFRVALANNVMYVEPDGVELTEVEPVPVPKKSAKKDKWQEYALEVSDIDPEVIENASRKDVITMLVVNGLIEKP